MDTPSTPGAAAPTTTTPAASSATPSASTPATTSSSPAATPASTTPSASEQSTTDNRSIEQVLADKMAPAFSKDGVGGELATSAEKTGEGTDPTPPAAGEEGEVAKEGEETQSAAGTDDTKPEEIDYSDPIASFQVEEVSGFGPKSLAETLATDPAAAAAINANPELKNRLFATARKAERAAKYDEILGSPDEAQVVVASHTAFTGISGLLSEVKEGDFGSVNAVVNAMLDQATLKDEDGNPLKNADGSVRTDGTVGRFFKNWFQQRLTMLSEAAKQKSDEEGQQAADIIMERAGLRSSTAGNEEELSEELKAQKADIERQRNELETTRRQQFEADLQASDARVDAKTDSVLDSALGKILEKATALDGFAKTSAEREIRKELRIAIAGSKGYKTARQNIEARPLGPKREQALSELNTRYIHEYLPAAARKVLAQAGVSMTTKAEERRQTQAAREEASRSESRGSLPPTKPAAPNTTSLEVIEQELTARLNRRPTTQELLAERMTRQSAAATR